MSPDECHDDKLVVFKFGGASLADIEGVERVAGLLHSLSPGRLLIVASAIGKTTNALEQLCLAFYNHEQAKAHFVLEAIKQQHRALVNALVLPSDEAYNHLENLFIEIEWVLEDPPHADFNFVYDQIVPVGELLATRILSAVLSREGLKNTWTDARDFVYTDNTYREAQIDWVVTRDRVRSLLPQMLDKGWVVIQGFIGSSSENYSTTLGREGSDYSASVLASILDAASVTVWKDVAGIMNADPKIYPKAKLLEKLSYAEAAELAFYGAKVIHPKTLRPLQDKMIPLYVRSFLHPELPGTCVSAQAVEAQYPSFIVKDGQLLVSLHTRDGSFIVEEHLSRIFAIFHSFQVKMNMMENSALSFSASVDENIIENKISLLLEALRQSYELHYNTGLTLITVRNFKCDPGAVDEVFARTEVLVETRTRTTLQRLVRYS